MSLLEINARLRVERRAARARVREHLALHWREESDAAIACAFEMPEINVRRLRQRMGLKKDAGLQREIWEKVGHVSGYKREFRRRNRTR